MVYNPPHTTKLTAGQRSVKCKMYAEVCMILWTYLTLLKTLYINLLRAKSVRWQWKHTHSFTSRLTGRVQIFGYKLHTSFDGCNASARPLQRFYTKPICVGDYCFYITKFKYHLCYYLNLFAILAKGTVRQNVYDRTQAPNANTNGGDASRVGILGKGSQTGV